jgi:hypothetical protein
MNDKYDLLLVLFFNVKKAAFFDMKSRQRKNREYTQEDKKEVVRLYEEGYGC